MDIKLEKQGAVAKVILDAPERRNALTPEMATELSGRLAEIESDPEIGVAIVEGAGGYFCAGAVRDILSDAAADPAADAAYRGLSAVYRSFADLAALGVPTIAGVCGGAVGAGFNLALAADVRIVATDAVLRSGFSRIGLHPGGGHLHLLARAAGHEATVATTLLEDPADGATAVRRGIALEAIDANLVADRCAELAAGVRDPELVRVATRTLRAQRAVGAIPEQLAIQAEQGNQMWSLRRSLDFT